jgi:glycosyltransferase involved in cell wall biosynthesis
LLETPDMAARVGIGVITYNRKDVLAETLARVRAHTTSPHELVVADDGSWDGTVGLVRSLGIRLVTGRNMGIAWNKNRALFLLTMQLNCDVVILLEDDSRPVKDGWEQDWIAASLRWGHINLAGEWLRRSFVRGSGTVDDPYLSTDVTAQCSGFSRTALLYGGYFDSRFRGFGQEHVEHTRRLVRIGFGGTYENIGGDVVPVFRMLRGDIAFRPTQSHQTPGELERNYLLCRLLLPDETYRMPWREDAELLQFRAEMDAAMHAAGTI